MSEVLGFTWDSAAVFTSAMRSLAKRTAGNRNTSRSPCGCWRSASRTRVSHTLQMRVASKRWLPVPRP